MTPTPSCEPPDEADGYNRSPPASSTSRLVMVDSINEAPQVRSCIRSLLVAYGDAIVVDSLLIADELTTDAFEFGQSARVVRLRITGGGQFLRVEVDSADTPSSTTLPRDAGLGRLLLELLTLTWGVDRHGRHKTTWAELDLAA